MSVNDENAGFSPAVPCKHRPHAQTQSQSHTPLRKPLISITKPTTSDKPTVSAPTNSPNLVKTLPVVLIGDSKCGKTSLCLSYLNKQTTVPNKDSILFETYENKILLENGSVVKLQIWDFPGNDYFDRFRPLGYVNAKAVAICFSLKSVTSLNNIIERWIPEVQTYCWGASRLIIGIGSELRAGARFKGPSIEYCHKLASSLNCFYIECSTDDIDSCQDVFRLLTMMSEGGGLLVHKRSVPHSKGSYNNSANDNKRVSSYKRRGDKQCLVM